MHDRSALAPAETYARERDSARALLADLIMNRRVGPKGTVGFPGRRLICDVLCRGEGLALKLARDARLQPWRAFGAGDFLPGRMLFSPGQPLALGRCCTVENRMRSGPLRSSSPLAAAFVSLPVLARGRRSPGLASRPKTGPRPASLGL